MRWPAGAEWNLAAMPWGRTSSDVSSRWVPSSPCPAKDGAGASHVQDERYVEEETKRAPTNSHSFTATRCARTSEFIAGATCGRCTPFSTQVTTCWIAPTGNLSKAPCAISTTTMSHSIDWPQLLAVESHVACRVVLRRTLGLSCACPAMGQSPGKRFWPSNLEHGSSCGRLFSCAAQ